MKNYNDMNGEEVIDLLWQVKEGKLHPNKAYKKLFGLGDVMVRYECANCGNRGLQHNRPDNSGCGGCDSPDWKIMKKQEAYIVGQEDWVHPEGEI